MKTSCVKCGRPIDAGLCGYTLCYSCQKANYNENIKNKILNDGETTVEGEYNIYCPYCGEEVELESCDDGDILHTDGDHEVECPYCDRLFIVNTTVQYSYDTRQK